MATYALCGFANFSSIAIQIGGISPMAPHRKKDIAGLGLKAVLGGSLATLMTATLAGILLGKCRLISFQRANSWLGGDKTIFGFLSILSVDSLCCIYCNFNTISLKSHHGEN